MKNFTKNINKKYVCQECGKTCSSIQGLSSHIKHKHGNLKEYYDKWLKEENEGLCKICGKETIFTGFKYFYENCCSKQCKLLYTAKRAKEGCLQKYGVENVFQLEKVKDKCKQTHLKNLGVEYPAQSEKIKKQKQETCLKNHGVKAGFADVEKRKKTNLEKYGVENYCNIEKINKTMFERYNCNWAAQNTEIYNKVIQTNLEKYGVKYTFQNNNIKNKCIQTKIERYGVENFNNKEKAKQTCLERYGVGNFNNKEKAKQTCLERYGVGNPSQVLEIHKKQQRSAFKLKKFRDTELWYQGSYELDFLEKYYDLYPDITRGPSIKYEYEGKEHYHFPDFYIPSKNLIVECKNSYLVKRDILIIKTKKKAALNKGFNYIIIINKNYNLLNLSVNAGIVEASKQGATSTNVLMST